MCRYIHQGLQISQDEATRLRRENLGRVLAARRLLLVLDLDHTLLNSTRLHEVRAFKPLDPLDRGSETRTTLATTLFCVPNC